MSILNTKLKSDEIFLEILNKCDDGEGKYINQGTYGLGLSFKISRDEDSPISYYSLDNRAETGAEMDSQVRTVFVKLVPLHKSKSYKWYMMGAYNNEISSSLYKSFADECSAQVEIYKKTNHNMDSFVPPLYFSDVIEPSVVDVLKQKFSFTSALPDDFFDELRSHALHKNRDVGIIMMPSMPIPPIKTGSRLLDGFGFYTNISEMGEYFNISNEDFTSWEYSGNGDNKNFVLKKYDELENIPHKKCMFYIVQMLSGLIDLLDNGWIHGDLHPSNVLINPRQICSTHCFGRDSNGRLFFDSDSPFLGKVFIIDYGTARRVSADEIKMINSDNETDERQIFRNKIKVLLHAKGSHNYSPIEYFSYDWFVSLFASRKADKKTYDYKTDLIQKNVTTMFDLVNDFREKRLEYQNMMIDNMSSYKDFRDVLNSVRKMNKSSKMGSVFSCSPSSSPSSERKPISHGGDFRQFSEKLNLLNTLRASPKKTMKKCNDKDVLREIFALSPSVLKSAGNRMVENILTGVESVEALQDRVEISIRTTHKRTRRRRRGRRGRRGRRATRRNGGDAPHGGILPP